MLLKLLPEQLDKFWPYIRFALEKVTPPNIFSQSGCLNNTLNALLVDSMQCWICTEDQEHILACVLTGVYKNEFLGTSVLRVMMVYGYESIPPSEWESGLGTLEKYAKGIGCSSLEAFTNLLELDSLAHKIGFESDIHLWKDI